MRIIVIELLLSRIEILFITIELHLKILIPLFLLVQFIKAVWIQQHSLSHGRLGPRFGPLHSQGIICLLVPVLTVFRAASLDIVLFKLLKLFLTPRYQHFLFFD